MQVLSNLRGFGRRTWNDHQCKNVVMMMGSILAWQYQIFTRTRPPQAPITLTNLIEGRSDFKLPGDIELQENSPAYSDNLRTIIFLRHPAG